MMSLNSTVDVPADDPQGRYTGLTATLNDQGASSTNQVQLAHDLDITQAISAHQKAIDLTPAGHSNLPSFLNNHANALMCRFDRTGDLADIAQAISGLQKAVALTPTDHPNLPSFLNNLANSLMRRFQRMGDLSDLAEAISAHLRVVQLTPAGHSNLPSYLNNLANALMCRFDRTGDLADIAQAISGLQEAISLTPTDHPNIPSFLNNLDNSFLRRFDRTGDMTDLTQAISASRKVIELTPADHSNLPSFLNNLANSLIRQFDRTGDLAALAEAISSQKKAIELTPAGHSYLPSFFNNLANSFLRRFDLTGDSEDIAQAISGFQRAVALTPAGHTNLPAFLSNLASSFERQFRVTNDASSISQAKAARQRAVEATSAGDGAICVPTEHRQRFSTKVQRQLLIRLVRMGGVVNFAWFGQESSPYPPGGDSLPDPGWHSGVAFTPYSGRIPLPKVSLDNVDEVVQLLAQHMNPPEPSEAPRTPTQDDTIDLYVCTHGARDCRCGETGGAVFRALKREVDRLGVGGKVRVGEVGHVGGHKYAANVLVYPHGEWLGLVTPSDVPSILSAILSRPIKPYREDDPLLLPEHWRGRMGIGKDEQIEMFGKFCTAPLGGTQ
ncbi:hypothetical protein MD484_g1431, partial [Candolleomyces efflorescens]